MFPFAMVLLLSAPEPTTPLELTTIRAHRGAGPSDPGTEIAARLLRSQGYASFTVESIQHHELPVGEEAALTVGPDHAVRVEVHEPVGNRVRLEVRLVRDGRLRLDAMARLPVNQPILLRAGSIDDADVFAMVVRPPPAGPSGLVWGILSCGSGRR